MKFKTLSAAVLCFCVSIVFAADIQPLNIYYPLGKIITGPDGIKGKELKHFPESFIIPQNASDVQTSTKLTPGHYIIRWEVPCPVDSRFIKLTAKLKTNNANQTNCINVTFKDASPINLSKTKDWAWEQVSAMAMLAESYNSKILFVDWEFNVPAQDNIWMVGFGGLTLQPLTEEEMYADFKAPMAEGLPEVANPVTHKKPWISKIELKDNIILKDGKPFFPIGYVFTSGEKGLAQAAAMGCNAVHLETGWNAATAPGKIPAENFNGIRSEIRLAGEWGMAVFPLLTGHYVPGWFGSKYSPTDYCPVGNDGKGTGSWFVYSLHFPEFRKHIVDFWKGASPVMAEEPNVVAINFWNEPCYGGTWNRGDQFADYSKWGIEDYQKYLEQKYKNIAELNKAYASKYTAFSAVQPPKKPAEQGRVAWLDWMEYGQHYFADFFNWEREVIHSVAPKARLANKKQTNMFDASAASSGTNWALMQESEDIFGLNIYAGLPGYRNNLAAAYSYANGKPVVIFEMNVMPPNKIARTPDRVRTSLWSPILGGARGMFIFCMGTDPEHGLFGEESTMPRARKEYVKFTQNVSRLQRELASPLMPARIAVLYSTTAALQTPGDSIPRKTMNAFSLIANSQYQVELLPEERCNEKYLSKYEMVVLPSGCILKKKELDVLGKWVNDGGKILAFSDSLATNEYMKPIKTPAWLGIDARNPSLGDRSALTIETVDEKLKMFLEVPCNITGVEMVSRQTSDKKLVPGARIDVQTAGVVLANNSDSYPSVVMNKAGNVVYCAFESTYTNAVRLLLEGILRNCMNMQQTVRFGNDDYCNPSILLSIRDDYKDKNIRYVLVINTLPGLKTVDITTPGWTIEKELIKDAKVKMDDGVQQIRMKQNMVYLFKLNKQEKK